jgi:hypothetical protein
MLIDKRLPVSDVTEICSIEVRAGWAAAYAAIKGAGPGFVVLDDVPGIELVAGSVVRRALKRSKLEAERRAPMAA